MCSYRGFLDRPQTDLVKGREGKDVQPDRASNIRHIARPHGRADASADGLSADSHESTP
jgi:hypothetical protein